MKKIDRNSGNLVMCIAEAVIGILLLVNPIGFTSGIIIALGFILTLLGVKELVAYFKEDPETAALSSGLAKGLICAVFGVFCMFRAEWFIVTFPILTVLYGILTLLNGISKVQWAVDLYRRKQKYWYIELLGAALTLIFAILIMADPFATTAVLWTFIAVTMIIEAIIDVIAFIMGRK